MELKLEIRKLSRVRQNLIFGTKVVIWIMLIASGVSLIAFSDDLLINAIGVFLIGGGFAHGVELQHQALHMTGFTSRLMNRLVGTMLGMPMLVSFCEYRDSHLYHHQKLGTSEDSEFFDYGERESSAMGALFKHFFLINHFSSFIKKCVDAVAFNKMVTRLSARNESNIRGDYLIMGAVFFGSLLAASHFDVVGYLFAFWMIPLFLVAAPIHALVELPEHYGCDRNTQDVFRNTRSIKASAFMTWFTNGNNYHVEHHWKAALPVELLKNVHLQIDHEIQNLSLSYFEFYKGFVKDVFFIRSEQKA